MITPVTASASALPTDFAPPTLSPTDTSTGGVVGTDPASTGTSGQSFGGALSSALDSLSASQANATAQTQALVTGKSTDVASVAMSVEQASVSLELASDVRDKMVSAYQTIFGMQV